jgi:hypothetical protein
LRDSDYRAISPPHILKLKPLIDKVAVEIGKYKATQRKA